MGYRLSGFLLAVCAAAQSGNGPLEQAYTHLRAKDYSAAIASFREALTTTPARPDIHKDLAYTLLKIGETETARDEFAEAMRMDPSDDHVALEYAFLCYETKQPAEARRVFDRLRTAASGKADRDTA